MTWEQVNLDWYSSELGEVCREEDQGWYFYPKRGEWTTVPFGPRHDWPSDAKYYAESRVEWI